jgi:hypothetical protein
MFNRDIEKDKEKLYNKLIINEHFKEAILNSLKWVNEYGFKKYNNNNYLKDEFINEITKNEWDRSISFAFISSIYDMYNQQGILTDEIDSDLDFIVSQLIGDCPTVYIIRFPNDPIDEDELRSYVANFDWIDKD